MKKLAALIVVALLWATCASAAVGHIASGQGFCNGSTAAGNMSGACVGVTSKTFTYTATTTGNAVLFGIGCGPASAPTITLSASGWTLTQVGSTIGSATAGFAATFKAYAPNTSAATFTFGCSVSSSFLNDLIDEFNGMDATNFVDNNGSGTNTTGGCSLSITPVVNDTGLWFACNDTVTGTGTYTKGADDTQGDVSEWKILSGGAGASQASGWTTTGAFTIFGVSIKPAGGAAACTPTLSLLGVGRCG